MRFQHQGQLKYWNQKDICNTFVSAPRGWNQLPSFFPFFLFLSAMNQILTCSSESCLLWTKTHRKDIRCFFHNFKNKVPRFPDCECVCVHVCAYASMCRHCVCDVCVCANAVWCICVCCVCVCGTCVWTVYVAVCSIYVSVCVCCVCGTCVHCVCFCIYGSALPMNMKLEASRCLHVLLPLCLIAVREKGFSPILTLTIWAKLTG